MEEPKGECQPRHGTCNKKATQIRVQADIRVAWIDYKLRYLCNHHSEEWDKALDIYLTNDADNRWGQITYWTKARDMNLFINDGLSFKEASDLVQSGHGYDPTKLPKVARLS